MLSGLIVFSTNVGDAKYILGEQDLIIPDEDSTLAANKILNKLSKNNLEELVENNRRRALNIFNEDIMNKNIKIYGNLLYCNPTHKTNRFENNIKVFKTCPT